jgi:hypothetical protein
MQQLHKDIGSRDGSTGVPSVIGVKRKSAEGDDSLSLSKKSKNLESSLGKSIEKHGESMLAVARMAAVEQQMNQMNPKQAHAEHECNCVENRINFLCGRINDLHDDKRGMVLQLADPAMQNQAIIDAVLREVKGIEDEIELNVEKLKLKVEEMKLKVEEMNTLIATPTKSNHSPK